MLLPGSLAPSQPLGFMAPVKPNALCSLASYITNYNPNPIKERVLCIMITYGSPFAFIACQGCGYSSSPPRRYAIRAAGAAEQGSVLQRRQSLGRRASRVGGTQQQEGGLHRRDPEMGAALAWAGGFLCLLYLPCHEMGLQSTWAEIWVGTGGHRVTLPRAGGSRCQEVFLGKFLF